MTSPFPSLSELLKNVEPSERKNMSDDDTKLCPVCAETIKKAAIKCRFCNADLQALAAAQDTDAEQLIFSGRPAAIYSAWQWVAVVFTFGIAYLFFLFKRFAIKYEISTQRIKIEYGLLSTEKNSIELFTIEHFDVRKPVGMRLAGFCILQLRSSDADYPNLTLYGIAGLEALADTLRECSLRERARRRITSIIHP
jgi:membrane protein YdbS with pleckstrin-like domain